MTALLKEELAFWRKEAPTLEVGWWNGLKPQAKREQYQNRYGILGPALRTVTELHYVPAREVVQELRDLWVSLPQLNDKSGLNQITEECDKASEALRPS